MDEPPRPPVSPTVVGVVLGVVALFPSMTAPFTALNAITLDTDLGQALYRITIFGGLTFWYAMHKREEKRRIWKAKRARKREARKAAIAKKEEAENWNIRLAEVVNHFADLKVVLTQQVTGVLEYLRQDRAKFNLAGEPTDALDRQIEEVETTLTRIAKTPFTITNYAGFVAIDGVVQFPEEELPTQPDSPKPSGPADEDSASGH
jgi:hypothetical protein